MTAVTPRLRAATEADAESIARVHVATREERGTFVLHEVRYRCDPL